MKSFQTTRLTLLALAIVSHLAALAAPIIGKVADAETGEAIIGATIYDARNHVGVVSDAEGHFRIDVASFPSELKISYIGYEQQTIRVKGDDKNIMVALKEEDHKLNEVVVVGYGTQKRTQLTGSVTKLKADIFEKVTAPTLDVALGGQVAGLNVTASSGQPGSDSHIRIRGGNSVNASNEPLYVVDGFIYFKDAANNSTGIGAIEGSLNPLATINPNDIESIEVLKDISATAIYGSRGANGVILITTKKGKPGDGKAHVSYNYSLGVSNIAKKLSLLNASEWAQYQKDYYSNKGGYNDAEIAALGKGTDWQDAVTRTAIQQTHEVSINGGTEKNRYAFSANYTDQDGVILNSDFQRYNFHTNVEWELQKDWRFGVNATYGRSKQQGLTTAEAKVFNSSPFSAGITNSFVYALLMPPVVSVYNADGSYNFGNPYEYAYFAIGDHSANPVYDLRESVAENINNYLLSNIWTTLRIDHLTLKASLGLNSEKLTQNYFSGAYTSLGLATQGIGGTGNRQTDVWQQEYTATYDLDLDQQHIDILGGYTRQTQTSTHSAIRTNHFTNESLKQYNLGDGAEIYTPKTGISEAKLNSFIARVNYTLADRYNATATFRADNSSRFAADHRWGYFPSLGLSWNVDREKFLQGIHDIDYLKVRLTGGLVGNQEISDYAFTTSYATGSYGGSSSYAKQNTANDKLKWETTASYNFGIDLGLWNDRVSVVFDAYYKKTSDLLLVVPMGFSSGVTTQLQNVGNVENKGVELAVNATLLQRKGLRWTASANVAYNHNEITNMGTTNNVIQGSDNQQILRRGEALGSFYGLRFAGIVQSDEDVSKLPTINGQTPKPGDLKFVDTDDNGHIDGNDRQILGSIQPDVVYGFSTQLTWHDFDLSASFAGSYGNEVYNALGRRLELTNDSYNVLSTIKDSWTPSHGGNTLPLASNARPIGYIDSRYVQDASYLKLRNLTIGYNLKVDSAKWKVESLRLYATASNLFTLTSYKGYDPEVASGTDSGVYPSSRSFVFGVNISL
ncbi:SusC/RagA family TonB-linked outer membrane protein [Xylanibacter brevis]|uniref:SusC/RagA family TonB-linked outer membrane protein n=1 Tax=Xylanibacter brevis TaxID=83231 RepID=UPI000488ACC7|nr:TonB-dependent receptor [Xylanibacter brevis]